MARTENTPEVVDLDELPPRTMSTVAQERAERDAGVSWTSPLGKVIGQDVILAQTLRNLLSNAMKFVARGTRPDVRVSTERQDGRLRVLVRDNGIGIAPEHHQRIFGMFERLNCAEDCPGTGMGLAIVRRAAERLGGRRSGSSSARHPTPLHLLLRRGFRVTTPVRRALQTFRIPSRGRPVPAVRESGGGP